MKNNHTIENSLPLPVSLITTQDSSGRGNAAPYGSIIPIYGTNDRFIVTATPPQDTINNIRETKTFIVNLMGSESFEKALKCSKRFLFDEDEIDILKLSTQPGKHCSALRISDAMIWIEATLDQEITEPDYVLIIGKVIDIEFNRSLMINEELNTPPIISFASQYRYIGEKVEATL